LAASIPHSTGIAALIKESNNNAPVQETTTSLFGDDGFTFGDIIDIINPLQHIPIVNSIYRKISGDTIAPAMEIAGGALFGGPIGAFTSMISAAFNSRDKIDSTDPDSPYKDSGSATTAIASNTSQAYPTAISIDDYSNADETNINQTNYNNPSQNIYNGWTLSSQSISREVVIDKANHHASINPLKSKQTYQPGDGIVNLAYKNTENYTDIITSKDSPEKTIDIIIGSTSGAG
jgi:hypothetical protein